MRWYYCLLLKIVADVIADNEVGISNKYFCTKPNTELFGNVTNCISNSYFFPSSSMSCDYCGYDVTFSCSANLTWETIDHVHECSSTKRQENGNKKCQGLNDKTLRCPDVTKDKDYDINTRTLCTCISNCRDFIVKCSMNTTAAFWSSDYKLDPCSNATTSITDGSIMKIHYENPTYTYECMYDYVLHGANMSSCKDGKLSAPKPICRAKKPFTIIASDMTVILYIIITMLIILTASLLGYLIYLKIIRKKNEKIEPENKLEPQESVYDYPVFHIIDDLNPNEDDEYAYPVLPIRTENSSRQHEEIKDNLEHIRENELYQGVEDTKK